MKKVITLLLILLSLNAYSQIVKFVKSPFQAKYRVFITQNRQEADLWVYKVRNAWEARGAGLWYVTPNAIVFDSKATKLYQVDNRFKADFIVWISPNRFQVGWKRNRQFIFY